MTMWAQNYGRYYWLCKARSEDAIVRFLRQGTDAGDGHAAPLYLVHYTYMRVQGPVMAFLLLITI